MEDLGLFWQLTLRTIEDLKIISNENLALEMYLTQLIHIKKIEDNDSTTIPTEIVLGIQISKKK